MYSQMYCTSYISQTNHPFSSFQAFTHTFPLPSSPFFLWSLVNVLSFHFSSCLSISHLKYFSPFKIRIKTISSVMSSCLHQFSFLHLHTSLSILHCTVTSCSKLNHLDKWFSTLCLSFLKTISWVVKREMKKHMLSLWYRTCTSCYPHCYLSSKHSHSHSSY